MAQQRKNGPKAGDATGRQKAAMEAEQAEVSAKRQEELTMINQAKIIEDQTGIFDPKTGTKVGESSEESGLASSAVATDEGVQTVDTGSGEVVIRVNETLTNVTIGAGNFYNFEEGKQYTVPKHVAAHLEEKGYLWH